VNWRCRPRRTWRKLLKMTSRWGSGRSVRGLIEDLKANVLDSLRCADSFNGLCCVTATCSEKRRNRINEALEPLRHPRHHEGRPKSGGRAAIRNIVAGTLNRIISHVQYDGIHLGPKLLDRERQVERSRDTVILEVAAVDGAFRRALWIVA